MTTAYCSDCARERTANPMGRCPVCGKEISERISTASSARHVKYAAKSLILPAAGGFLALAGLGVFFVHPPIGLCLMAGGLGTIGHAVLERYLS